MSGPSIKIYVSVGSTVQVRNGPQGDFDFIKPSVGCEIKWDLIPLDLAAHGRLDEVEVSLRAVPHLDCTTDGDIDLDRGS